MKKLFIFYFLFLNELTFFFFTLNKNLIPNFGLILMFFGQYICYIFNDLDNHLLFCFIIYPELLQNVVLNILCGFMLQFSLSTRMLNLSFTFLYIIQHRYISLSSSQYIGWWILFFNLRSKCVLFYENASTCPVFCGQYRQFSIYFQSLY